MGITLREVIAIYAKGMKNNASFKLAQTGGSSGSIIPASLQDTPMDFDSFGKAGVALGSGALLICNEDTCVVDLAKVLLNFFRNESCGKCNPCRIGTQRAYQIMDGISEGIGAMKDLDDLRCCATTCTSFQTAAWGRLPEPRCGISSDISELKLKLTFNLKVCPTGICPMSGQKHLK